MTVMRMHALLPAHNMQPCADCALCTMHPRPCNGLLLTVVLGWAELGLPVVSTAGAPCTITCAPCQSMPMCGHACCVHLTSGCLVYET